mgnify:CR=1 FL=1
MSHMFFWKIMINGVKIKQLKVFKDKPDLEQEVLPGVFMEVLRDDDKLLKRFDRAILRLRTKIQSKHFTGTNIKMTCGFWQQERRRSFYMTSARDQRLRARRR